MAAAQAQIQSSGMVNSMGMGMAGTGMLNAGGMGHTPDQQQYFMQQMAQMQAQQQQRQQAQMGLGMGMDNVAGGFQQLEQVSSSHGVGGFGGDSAAAAAAGGGGGLNHPGAFIQQPAGVGSVDKDSSNGNSIPSAPAMVPMNVINPSGTPLDADAQAQQDRLIQQQQLLQQQHQKLLEQQELLRQLQEQQRALQQQQMQAVQLEQQQQNMTGGVVNNTNVANVAGMAGMTDFPGVPGGIGAMNPSMMQNMQQQQQQPQAVSTGADNGAPQIFSSLLNQQEQTVPTKPPAPSGGAGAGRFNRRGSLTFDDLVKGIKSAKAAQKMGMSSTNMSLSVGDIDSNLSSAFEDSLIISVEGSLANSSNSEKKPAAAAAGVSGGNVASASQNRPTQSNGPGGVPENVTVNQQQQPGSGPMGESSMLRGMAMSDAGMSFSLSDAADLLGGSVMQMSYRGFPESKQDDQDK